MLAVDIIKSKRDGRELSAAEIGEFVTAAARGTWPDYQLAALLMAIVTRGMNPAETAILTRAMADSGVRIDLADLPGVKVDKHSTGGVGDKTSLILAPLAAACGVVVPMMSGRGLGHTGGTLDKLESIPGFRVNLSIGEFKSILRIVGCAMIGQTADVAPADKKLYALRDVTGTVECIPLITGSILSKKLAEGISGLVMDIKCGRGAFMKNRPESRALAQSIVRGGTANGLAVEAVITDMDSPLGCAVGNALEVLECLEVLKGGGPNDLKELSVDLAARMVRMAGKAETLPQAREQVNAVLQNGEGLKKFRELVAAQGGNALHFEQQLQESVSKDMLQTPFPSKSTGFLHSLDAEKVGRAALLLGAGRQRAEDVVDPGVGIVVRPSGTFVNAGEPMMTLYHRDARSYSAAAELLESAAEIGPEPPRPRPLILEEIA